MRLGFGSVSDPFGVSMAIGQQHRVPIHEINPFIRCKKAGDGFVTVAQSDAIFLLVEVRNRLALRVSRFFQQPTEDSSTIGDASLLRLPEDLEEIVPRRDSPVNVLWICLDLPLLDSGERRLLAGSVSPNPVRASVEHVFPRPVLVESPNRHEVFGACEQKCVGLFVVEMARDARSVFGKWSAVNTRSRFPKDRFLARWSRSGRARGRTVRGPD